MFDAVGDYAYICVSDACPYPLNIPPAVLDEQPDETGFPQSLRQRLAWPIPFWAVTTAGPLRCLVLILFLIRFGL